MLHHGDGVEMMKDKKLVLPGSIDLFIPDPPYGKFDRDQDRPIPFTPMWEAMRQAGHERSAYLFFSAQPFTSDLTQSNRDEWRDEWTWEKAAPTGGQRAKIKPMRCTETIQVFYDKRPIYNPQMWLGKQRKVKQDRSKRKNRNSNKETGITDYNTNIRYPRNALYCPSDKQFNNLHPTQKPLGLVEYFILTYSNPGSWVCDFTAGSFTTAMACWIHGRNFIGAETDLEMFQIGQKRMERKAESLLHRVSHRWELAA